MSSRSLRAVTIERERSREASSATTCSCSFASGFSSSRSRASLRSAASRGADGVIARSPVYFGTMAAELKEVFEKCIGVRKRMEGKIGATFATSGDPSGGKETTLMSIIQALLIYGMIVVGDPLDATGHYGVSCVGSPDKDTQFNAALLGKRVASLVKRLRSD